MQFTSTAIDTKHIMAASLALDSDTWEVGLVQDIGKAVVKARLVHVCIETSEDIFKENFEVSRATDAFR